MPELVVNDVEKSVDFYVNILGFEKIFRDEHFARLKVGESELMVTKRAELDPEMQRSEAGSSILVIEIDGIEEIYEMVKDQVKILRNLVATDYGTKEFDFEDVDGYMIQFTERNEN